VISVSIFFCFVFCHPPFKSESVHKVQIRFTPLLPGYCFDSQYSQISQLNRWPTTLSAGISGVSNQVHLVKRVSEG
jgi:hypothetical protein